MRNATTWRAGSRQRPEGRSRGAYAGGSDESRSFHYNESGMLEHRILLVRPRAASAVQAIVDGDSGAPLGFARWQAQDESPWWHFFGRRVLAVHEHEDEPLLFTIRRAWSLLPRREVRDAEGQIIGSLLGPLIHDPFGRTVAARQGGNDGIFRGPDRRTLAEAAPTADGLRISFSADIAGEPFVKMLLLAAVLLSV
jgi:hypothetical protein